MLRRLALLALLAAGTAAVTTKVTSKAQSNEKRINQVVTQLNAMNSQLNFAALANFQSPTNTAFLASLSKLPHQTTSNSSAGADDTNTGPYWASGERGFVNNAIDAVNGLVTAVNNLQSNLQANGFES